MAWGLGNTLALGFATLAVFASAACGQGYPPAVAAKRMTVPGGLRIQPFAHEPMIRQPNVVEFDDRGRLWVVQYLQYANPAGLKRVKVDRYSRTVYDAVPPPPPLGPRGADRITIVEDQDGDGSADRSHDFLTGLNLASGLAFGHGGVFVLQVPYLLFYPDRDRNDVPDGDPEVLLSGFGMEDAHSVANSLTWGPDGWLYGLQGSTVTARIRGIEFQQGVWRYHPKTRRFELFCEGGGNMWGLDFDAHGNLFASTNVGGSLMLHAVQGAYCWKSFGKHGPLHNPYTYGYFDHVKHQGAGEGHVSVGGLFYFAEAFPERFRGKYISGDLLGHSVHWNELAPRGSTFESRHLGDLLIANDTWFAPTDLTLGPDGAVYVADWHDKRTAHPDPDADWDKTNGRVYAIRAQAGKPVGRIDLALRTSAELVNLLGHPNAWYARRARRLLIERRDPTVNGRLRTLALEPGSGHLGLEAFWTLAASGGLDPALAETCLKHSNEDIRVWTLRFLGDEGKLPSTLSQPLLQLAETEPRPTVRAQLACTAKRLPAEDGLSIASRLAIRDQDGDDPHVPLLLWWAIEQHAIRHTSRTLELFASPAGWRSNLVRRELLPRLMRRFAADGSQGGDDACARLLATAPTSKDRYGVLASIEEGFSERSSDALQAKGGAPSPLRDPIFGLWLGSAHDPLLIRLAARLGNLEAQSQALRGAVDSRESEATRVALFGMLADLPRTPPTDAVLGMLLREEPAGVQGAALRVLGRATDERIADALLSAYPSKGERWRSQVRSLLLSRRSWARRFLIAVDGGRVSAKEIPLDQLRGVALLQDSELDSLVRKHWGTVKKETPEEKLAEVRRLNNDLRASSGDSGRGRSLFNKHCGTCHRLFGEGNLVGPELTHANRQDRDFLLVSLVDPNAVVRKEYQGVVISTKDGRVLTGLLGEQSAGQVTLLGAKNERAVLPRAAIDAITDSPVSLMAENLYKEFSPTELRDLFAYLQADGPRAAQR